MFDNLLYAITLNFWFSEYSKTRVFWECILDALDPAHAKRAFLWAYRPQGWADWVRR
jgi:hypothetical protein